MPEDRLLIPLLEASREMVNRVMKDLTSGGYAALRDGRCVIRKKLPAARGLGPRRASRTTGSPGRE